MPFTYRDNVAGLRTSQLCGGFFSGWPSHPNPATHLRLLAGSEHCWLALDDATDEVVGFITAVGDGVLSAYIPFLEVLPSYRGRGIGRELVRRMLATLNDLYMVDLSCDPEMVPFYRQFGLRKGVAMMRRRYDAQQGK